MVRSATRCGGGLLGKHSTNETFWGLCYPTHLIQASGVLPNLPLQYVTTCRLTYKSPRCIPHKLLTCFVCIQWAVHTCTTHAPHMHTNCINHDPTSETASTLACILCKRNRDLNLSCLWLEDLSCFKVRSLLHFQQNQRPSKSSLSFSTAISWHTVVRHM